ncbi:hypothetical protein AXG93_1976s1620 [Marchantia polymorpha subsp. ruderalis]|uniref:Uncharacterized protein n=1 Tax=Marchantia polymorpha subsp. ruderalis TaxID=1480154 RepID=A0A176VGC4_MARPO|nr:hypothetical protein AXG93_1976s1620 [Marchantia polymorpha subsp. ruderalis]
MRAFQGAFAPTLRYRARTSGSERKQNRPTLLAAKTRIGDMAPKKNDKVRKLVPLKVPYVELRPFRFELSKLRLDFLLWNWNCVSTSICKEIMDKNETKGKELQGNTMLWTIEHWEKAEGSLPTHRRNEFDVGGKSAEIVAYA